MVIRDTQNVLYRRPLATSYVAIHNCVLHINDIGICTYKSTRVLQIVII